MSEQRAPATGGRLSQDELCEFLAGAWICRLGTLDEDGGPCVTPVWYEYEPTGGEASGAAPAGNAPAGNAPSAERLSGSFVIVGRERSAWIEHIRRNPRVALCIDDPDGAHRRVLVRGRAEIVEGPSVRGGWLPIARRMAERYMGGPDGGQYMERTLDFPRVLVRVTPVQTTTWRGGWAKKYTR